MKINRGRNGHRQGSFNASGDGWDWQHKNGDFFAHEIIAYRVVENAAPDEKPTIEIRIVERDQSYLSEIEYRYLLTTGYSDWRIAERVRLP
jgi:hypothetical protein